MIRGWTEKVIDMREDMAARMFRFCDDCKSGFILSYQPGVVPHFTRPSAPNYPAPMIVRDLRHVEGEILEPAFCPYCGAPAK
jgi:hypothetical protein